MVPLRLCKATLVAAISLFFLIVVANNITDYDSNYEFVRHVLSMDDTFPHNSELWRSLPYPILFQIFYAGIILTEAVSALLCGYGAYRLAKTSRLSGSAF
jgi:predicted small integral membrane protein